MGPHPLAPHLLAVVLTANAAQAADPLVDMRADWRVVYAPGMR